MTHLPDAARIGRVELNVPSLDEAVAFYGGVLGMRAFQRDGGEATLGADEPFLVLHETPNAAPRAPGQAGLYHVAYLLPSRADLGRAIRHLVQARWPLEGASDHLVSEALYLSDPFGNGIEIYADRPRDTWRSPQGGIRMATQPMDVEGVVRAGEGAAWAGIPKGTRVGHIHLQVNEQRAAESFYHDVVGLDVTAHYPGATFLSAGGYHHHVGMNVWGTQGGPPAASDRLGLARFEIVAPDVDEKELVDPSGNHVRVVRG